MRHLKPYLGVALIAVGALLFLFHQLSLVSGNVVLLLGLLFVISGIITHLYVEKYGGKY